MKAMNEFTKDELNDLNVLLTVWLVKYPMDKITAELQVKLQSMIDSYCEHTRQMPNYNIQTQCADCLEIL